jgi:hypothetical protein
VEVAIVMYSLTLTQSGAEALARPVRGSGGFQTLLRSVQKARRSGNTILIDEELAERIRRYVVDYGSGGFQSRLARLGALHRVEAA